MRRTFAIPSLALVLSAGLAGAAVAGGSTPLTTDRILSGLQRPVWIGPPPGETDRLFVLEAHTNLVRIAKKGPTGWTLSPTPFLDVSAKAHSAGSERGLLSLAFHPDYQENGLLYVYYTSPLAGVGSRIERYTVDPADPDKADPATAMTILEQSQPFSNHNGGNLQFGPDGFLYFGFGDGGSGGDPACNAQKLDTWLGKMLRIDVDSGDPYRIPTGNPFVGTPGALPEIFHLGLRNPWRWSFDAETGDAYIADVGQNAREEISVAFLGDSGLNFGWKVMEGFNCFSTASCPPGTPPCGDPVYTDPVHDYSHAFGCSVTGGFVYRGCAIPDLRGTYFFGDFCSARIWSFVLDPSGTVTQFQERTGELAPGGGLGISAISTFGVTGHGELLVVDMNDGEVFQVLPASPPSGFVDCDQNGQDDGCEIAEAPHKDLDGDGVLDVCQSLSADKAAISAAGGGTQTLSLHAGSARGGDLYLVAGSLTGSCCIPIGSVTIPLTFDGYTLHTINQANVPPLVQTAGFLDGGGEATALFDAAPGVVPASLVGTTAFHAYGLMDVGTGAIDFASNFVTLDFLP